MKRIPLVLLGALLALFALEMAMRVGAMAWTVFANSSAMPSNSSRGVFRILCLGESTTAPTGGHDISWPAQLQNILNASSREGKYEVINRGAPGINTGLIVAQLPNHLDELQPDLVITMMGVNDDQWYGIVRFKGGWVERFFSDFKVGKLCRYIKQELTEASNRSTSRSISSIGEVPYISNDSSLAKACRAAWMRYIGPEDFQEWESACKEAIRRQPQDVTLYAALMAGYHKLGRASSAHEAAKIYISNGGSESWPYALLIRNFAGRGMHFEAESVFRNAMNSISREKMSEVYMAMVKLYGDPNQNAKAARMYRLAAQEKASFAPSITVSGYTPQERPPIEAPVTAANYQTVQRMLAARRIPLVAMQYPTKAVSELKGMFSDPAGILFVGNEENFRHALAHGRYSDYFIDRFQKSWGHCSATGDRLIAENLAKALRRHVLLDRPAGTVHPIKN